MEDVENEQTCSSLLPLPPKENNNVREILRQAVIFARLISFTQLREYVESLHTMNTHWVQAFSAEYILPLLQPNYKHVVFVQMGPRDNLISRVLNKQNVQVWILNTEQMSRVTVNECEDFVSFPFEDCLLRFVRDSPNNSKRVRILDYSSSNISVWRSLFPETRVGLVEFLPQPVVSPSANVKTRKAVFVGDTHSTHRLKVLTDLADCVTIVNDLFGEERDQLVYRHGLLVNIHFGSSYTVFEQLRCLPCVLAKMLVISEESDFDLKHPLYPFIIFCPYDKLDLCVRSALSRFQRLYEALYVNNAKFDSLLDDIAAYEKQHNGIYFKSTSAG